MPSTAAEQEAERRYPALNTPYEGNLMRAAFVAGADWALEPYRELLEAAREYRGAVEEHERTRDELRSHFGEAAYSSAVMKAYWQEESARDDLLAAAAALNEE